MRRKQESVNRAGMVFGAWDGRDEKTSERFCLVCGKEGKASVATSRSSDGKVVACFLHEGVVTTYMGKRSRMFVDRVASQVEYLESLGRDKDIMDSLDGLLKPGGLIVVEGKEES